MRSRSNSGVRLDYYQRMVSHLILEQQHPVSGLLPPGKDHPHAWTRDNLYSIVCVWALSIAYKKHADLDEDIAKAYELEQSVVKLMRGLLTSMMRQVDKLECFKKTQSKSDCFHAKYSVETGEVVVADHAWGHLQMDATSLFLLTLAQMTTSGLQIVFTLDEVDFVQNLVFYIEVAYRIPDFGIWERGDKTNHGLAELNASSIGMAKAALEALNELDLFTARGGVDSVIYCLMDEAQQCNATLRSMLPRESASKEVDSALLTVVGFPAFAIDDSDIIDATVQSIQSKLQGRYGCCRFLRDGYMTAKEDPGRLYYESWELRLFDNIECEWPMFFAYSALSGLFTGKGSMASEYLEALEQLLVPYGSHGLRVLPELYKVPSELVEAEYRDPGSQDRVAAGRIPHLWTTSLYVLCRLINENLVSPGELDPLNRRLGSRPKPDLVVQVVILAETPYIQQRLSVYGVQAQTFAETAPIRVLPAKSLSFIYSQLGKNRRLGLSGRPNTEVGLLATSKLYNIDGQIFAFLPQHLDQEGFYLALDEPLLMDIVRSDIESLRYTWTVLGRPVVILPVRESVIKTDSDGRRALHPSLMATIRKLHSGYINGCRITVGNLSDFVNTSCVTKIAFMTNTAKKRDKWNLHWGKHVAASMPGGRLCTATVCYVADRRDRDADASADTPRERRDSGATRRRYSATYQGLVRRTKSIQVENRIPVPAFDLWSMHAKRESAHAAGNSVSHWTLGPIESGVVARGSGGSSARPSLASVARSVQGLISTRRISLLASRSSAATNIATADAAKASTLGAALRAAVPRPSSATTFASLLAVQLPALSRSPSSAANVVDTAASLPYTNSEASMAEAAGYTPQFSVTEVDEDEPVPPPHQDWTDDFYGATVVPDTPTVMPDTPTWPPPQPANFDLAAASEATPQQPALSRLKPGSLRSLQRIKSSNQSLFNLSPADVAARGAKGDVPDDGDPNASAPSLLTWRSQRVNTAPQDVDWDALVRLLADSDNIMEQADILHFMHMHKGPDWQLLFPVAGASDQSSPVSVRELLAEIYQKASNLRQWWLVRHIAGMLDKRVDGLAKVVTDLLVRQKQLSVGLPSRTEKLIDSPRPPDELAGIIKEAYGDDLSTAMLTQELLFYLAIFIRTEPKLFAGIQQLRVGLIVQVMASELAASLKCSGEEASDHLLNLSPYEMKTLLHHIFSGKEFGIKAEYSSLANSPTTSIFIQTLNKRDMYMSREESQSVVNSLAEDETGPEERHGQWLRRRRLDGCLNRVPVGFYSRIWTLLQHCGGISIYNYVLPNSLIQEMTMEELKFALKVEAVFNRIQQPEFRQLLVEALAVLTLLVDQGMGGKTLSVMWSGTGATHAPARWRFRCPGVIVADQIVYEANDLFLDDQQRNDGDAVCCCAVAAVRDRLRSAARSSLNLPCGGTAGICRHFYDSAPSGRFGSMTYLCRAAANILALPTLVDGDSLDCAVS